MFIVWSKINLHNALSIEFLFIGIIITGPTEGGNFSFLILRKAKLSRAWKKTGREVIIVR